MNTLHKIKKNPIAKIILLQIVRYSAQHGAEYFRKRREKRYRTVAIRYRELQQDEPEPRVVIKHRNPVLFAVFGLLMGVAAGMGLSHLLPTRK